MSVCAGASQIDMMAEEKSPSRFFFAPSLTLRNGEEDGIKIRACELSVCAGASQIDMMAEEKSPSRFFFAPSLTLRNGEEDGIKIRACELFIWYGHKARGTCAGRCVSGDS